MKEILKIEKVNTVKSLFATLIDLLFTAAVGVVFFFFVFTPIFEATTTLSASKSYIQEMNVVQSTDDKVGYDLTFGDNLDYTKYINEGKKFYEYYETEITNLYYTLALEDEKIEDEYKERFKDIHLVFNYVFLGLDYKAIPTDESSYSNSYFIYQFDNETKDTIWNEYGIDNPRTLELNKRGLSERQDYCKVAYQGLRSMLMSINKEYKEANADVSLYNCLSALLAGFTSIVIFYLVLPLILGNYATIGKKIFGYGYINTNGKKLTLYKGPIKTLIASILPLLGLYTFNIYTLIILIVFPIFINVIYFVLTAKDQDLIDKILKMQLVDIKNSLFFNSEDEENEYLKNESLDDYDENEKAYTDLLSNLSTLDLKSIEEKIEDKHKKDNPVEEITGKKKKRKK